MNVFALKIIALTAMVIDHYGAIFQDNITFFRIIGRLAFPIYCFLLVEGYYHTGNLKKYAIRLFIFALISELPFDLAFFGRIDFSHQNIFFTLFIGLSAIYVLDKAREKTNFYRDAVIITACVAAFILSVDYSVVGIVYILTFYYTRSLVNLKKFKITVFIMLLSNIPLSWIQQFSLLSLPVIYFYNGEPGPRNKFLQMAFYAAYPLHLLMFYFINTM